MNIHGWNLVARCVASNLPEGDPIRQMGIDDTSTVFFFEKDLPKGKAKQVAAVSADVMADDKLDLRPLIEGAILAEEKRLLAQ